MLNCNNWDGRWRERGAGSGAGRVSAVGCRVKRPCASWLVLASTALGGVYLQNPPLSAVLLQLERGRKGWGRVEQPPGFQDHRWASQRSCMAGVYHQVRSQGPWLLLQPHRPMAPVGTCQKGHPRLLAFQLMRWFCVSSVKGLQPPPPFPVHRNGHCRVADFKRHLGLLCQAMSEHWRPYPKYLLCARHYPHHSQGSAGHKTSRPIHKFGHCLWRL